MNDEQTVKYGTVFLVSECSQLPVCLLSALTYGSRNLFLILIEEVVGKLYDVVCLTLCTCRWSNIARNVCRIAQRVAQHFSLAGFWIYFVESRCRCSTFIESTPQLYAVRNNQRIVDNVVLRIGIALRRAFRHVFERTHVALIVLRVTSKGHDRCEVRKVVICIFHRMFILPASCRIKHFLQFLITSGITWRVCWCITCLEAIFSHIIHS